MGQWIARRNLIGSDAAIVLTCCQDVYFASLFLGASDANGSIGLASLLMLFRLPWLAAVALLGFACLAVIAEWAPGLSRLERFALLFPQMTLLIITALGALAFVIAQHYGD